MILHAEPKTRAVFAAIVHQANIRWAVETGTFDGDGAIELRKLIPHVYTIENRTDFASKCRDKLNRHGITQFLGSSPDVLREELPILIQAHKERPPLFFLDAHWQDFWPLRDELIVINDYREAGLKCVTIVYEMSVPRAPQFAGCTGGGGTPGDPIYGPKTADDPTPCDYATFAKELNAYSHFYWPNWSEGGTGFGVASDFPLELPEMRTMR